MPQHADSNYDTRPWTQNRPVQVKRPSTTYEDSMTAAALDSVMNMSVEDIQSIRPPMRINLFPPRFGYQQEPFSIDDIVRLDDIYRRVDYSQRQSGFSGTSYPSLNQF